MSFYTNLTAFIVDEIRKGAQAEEVTTSLILHLCSSIVFQSKVRAIPMQDVVEAVKFQLDTAIIESLHGKPAPSDIN